MYTIGQVAGMFHLPVSTLRYYDKEGLFPGMERRSGIRLFGETEQDRIRLIECLKASGLEIRDIKQFIAWSTEGSTTYPQRLRLLEARKTAVEEELRQLQKTLDMLRFKCWYYETAMADGGEDRVRAMLPDRLPDEIRKLYESSHGGAGMEKPV